VFEVVVESRLREIGRRRRVVSHRDRFLAYSPPLAVQRPPE
jgi:hypothetical protein